MKKGDIVKFTNPLDDNEANEGFSLLETPDGECVLAEGVCNMQIRPTRVLCVEEILVDKKKMAFSRARQLACGSACGRCGKTKLFPEGLGLYEEPYCEPVWLCEECYPESGEEDDE